MGGEGRGHIVSPRAQLVGIHFHSFILFRPISKYSLRHRTRQVRTKTNKLRGIPLQYASALCDLDLCVTWATSVLIFNFSFPIDLSVLDLGPMYATDRQTSDTASSLNAPD